MSFPNQGNNACQTALNAASDQTKTTATINLLESYSRQQIKNNVNNNLLYGSIATAAVINAYNSRTIMAQLPINNNIELSTNLTLLNQQFSLKYKLEW